jgi:hypothetical protein
MIAAYYYKTGIHLTPETSRILNTPQTTGSAHCTYNLTVTNPLLITN